MLDNSAATFVKVALSLITREKHINILESSRPNHGARLKGGLITSLQPLRIVSCPSHPPRAPTLQECEAIIRQLYNANSFKSQEVSINHQTVQIRIECKMLWLVMCLLDCPRESIAERYCAEQENHPRKLHSDQGLPRWWSPVKLYFLILPITQMQGTLEITSTVVIMVYTIVLFSKSSEDKKFPKLGLQTFPEETYVNLCSSCLLCSSIILSYLHVLHMPRTNVILLCSNATKRPFKHKSTCISCPRSGTSHSGVILPALKQSISSTIAERQRRTRAVQRGRFKTTVRWQDKNYRGVRYIHLRTVSSHGCSGKPECNLN